MKASTIKMLQSQKEQIIELWMENQMEDPTLREDLMSNEDLRVQSIELIDALLHTLTEANSTQVESQDFEPVFEILAGISLSRARQGYTPRETAVFIFSLKDAIFSVLRTNITDLALLNQELLEVSKLIDSLGIVTFETFIQGREEVILRQTDEIAEISTPIIRVWDGIIALPIIGTLDSARTQIVMENLLVEIVNSESSIAILDISGVPAVDSLVAQHLIKTVSATRLMGAECIISGIRPEIAQTIVHLGIDLSSIITKATLASALRQAFTMLQLEVIKVRKDKKA
ncbi:STAS domain-containing protein [Siphonobacter sp.]|uniref:STAS domain-containing protein n=1 Tax=Siphonobacter sp. TaxID=1869184 RepID=UPI003B3AC509